MRAASRRAARAVHASLFAAPIASILLFAPFPTPAVAGNVTAGTLEIEHPYALATPPGARTGGAYFTLHNEGKSRDTLVGVASPSSKSAEVHSMTMDGNVMRMRAVPSLDVPPGGTVTLRPGGYHVMLIGLVRPLKIGDKVPLTLTFEKAGSVQVMADVRAATQAPSH